MRFVSTLCFALAAALPLFSQPAAKPHSTSRARQPANANFAAHPYMGWSSWSLIRAHPTEENIKAQADALLANHLQDFGYRYINVDDGWSDGFDDHGIPKPNLTRFPDGMDGMAKLHARPRPQIRHLSQPWHHGGAAQAQPADRRHLRPHRRHHRHHPGRQHAPRRLSVSISASPPRPPTSARRSRSSTAGASTSSSSTSSAPAAATFPADNREELRQWHAAVAQRLASHLARALELALHRSGSAVARHRKRLAHRERHRVLWRLRQLHRPRHPRQPHHWSKVALRFADVVRWVPLRWSRFAGRWRME